MAHATDYADWSEAAREHDRLSGAADWKEWTESSEFDYRLIQARLQELSTLRRRGEVTRLVFCLHEGLHGNLGNIANPALYSQCRFGTKRLLTEYLDEVATALDYLCDYETPAFSPADKLRFFLNQAEAYYLTSPELFTPQQIANGHDLSHHPQQSQVKHWVEDTGGVEGRPIALHIDVLSRSKKELVAHDFVKYAYSGKLGQHYRAVPKLEDAKFWLAQMGVS